MHLVDDVDAVPGVRRREIRLLDQRADAVDAVVARGVDLHDVEDRAVVQAAANRAGAARVAVLRVEAVDRCFARIFAQVVLPVPRERVNK